MTAATVAVGAEARTRSWAAAGFLLLLAGLAALAFGAGTDPDLDTTFVLTERGAAIDVPDLVIPSATTGYLIALACAGFAGFEMLRGFGSRTMVVVGVAVALVVFAFLTWAAKGESMNLLGVFQSTVQRATPLALGASCGVLCERTAGIVNISIEGHMLAGAFTGAVVASAAENLYVGVLGAVAVGGLFGAALAVMSIRYRIDQIIGATVINFFALGMTSFLGAKVLAENPDLNSPGVFAELDVPLLGDIPIVGPILFQNNIIVYAMYVVVGGLTLFLFRSRWGLRGRSVGEYPRAADTVGVNVHRTQYRNVILGGMVAGLAGAFLTLGSVGRFEENMTAGRGFISLAAMIVGRWHPLGAVGAALIFGFAESAESKLALYDQPIPSEFLLMAPYLATILVVAGFIGRARPPAGEGKPYVKE